MLPLQRSGSAPAFCTTFETLYGEQYVTPNMHMHGHLISTLLDYGPVYSFWLLSYERYNGILGNFPTNQKSIEVQLMQRFLRDNIITSMELPDEYGEKLGAFLSRTGNTSGSLNVTMSDAPAIPHLLDYATLPINEVLDWECDLKIFKLQLPKQKCIFTEDEYHELLNVYKVLYPNLTTELEEKQLARSFWKYNGCKFSGEYLGSTTASTTERSSLALAAWAGRGGEIDISACKCPCQVEFYILHYLVLNEVPKPHVFVEVKWLQRLPDDFSCSYGKPVEPGSTSSFDMGGPSSYMPVQRIFCKFVAGHAQHKRLGKIMYVIPRNGMVCV